MLIDLNQLSANNIDIGEYKHTRGHTPPVNPNAGDTWDEITPAGEWIHDWFWNAPLNRWLSIKDSKMSSPGTNNISGNGTQVISGHSNIIDADMFFIKAMFTFYPINGPINEANYWNLSIRFISAIEESSFVGFDTPPAPDFVQAKTTIPINTLLVTTDATHQFYRFAHFPFGSPSLLLNPIASLIYRLARKV